MWSQWRFLTFLKPKIQDWLKWQLINCFIPKQRYFTTIKENKDKRDKPFTMDYNTLAEEGLDKLWNPAAEMSPCSSASKSTPCLAFSFEKANNSFSPKPLTSHNWNIVNVSDNVAINKGIENLQNILCPCCHTGKGYKGPKLPNLLQGQLKLMLGFLRPSSILVRLHMLMQWQQPVGKDHGCPDSFAPVRKGQA